VLDVVVGLPPEQIQFGRWESKLCPPHPTEMLICQYAFDLLQSKSLQVLVG